MIGRLSGTLVEESGGGNWIVDVQGVGYEVQVPQGSLGRGSGGATTGSTVVLHIHTHVREESLELFGFGSATEREVFRLLIGVPNVGPRSAVAILGALPPAELAAAVQSENPKRLTAISGVGKKTAERLILELTGKLDRLEPAAPRPQAVTPGDGTRLVGALTNMGYRPQEAQRAVAALGDRVGKQELSELLKAALAELA